MKYAGHTTCRFVRGLGSRLGALTRNIPKPLLPVGGSPFLLRLLLQWKQEGVGRFILAAHYLAEQFRAFAAEHAAVLGDVAVIAENKPLGTGGGIRHAALQATSQTLLVANGDSYVSQPLGQLLEEHERHQMNFSMVAVRAENVLGGARKKGTLKIGPHDELIGFSTEETATEGWINAGLMSWRGAKHYPGRKNLVRWKMISDFRKPSPNACLEINRALLDIGTTECYATLDRNLVRSTTCLKRVINFLLLHNQRTNADLRNKSCKDGKATQRSIAWPR